MALSRDEMNRRAAILAIEIAGRHYCPYCGSCLIAEPIGEGISMAANFGFAPIACSDIEQGCPATWPEWRVYPRGYSRVMKQLYRDLAT